MERTRDPALLAGTALLLGVLLVGILGSVEWIGRPFPGFLVLDNRVVASAGLAHWPAVQDGTIYQHEVEAVDGTPLGDARDLVAMAGAHPVGTPLRYRLRSGQERSEHVVETRRFSRTDYLLLFGSYLFCGTGIALVALALRFLGRQDRVANGSALALAIIALWALTAVDLYGPYRMFQLHALAECFLFAGTLHLALVFPHPRAPVRRMPSLPALGYVAAAVLGLVSMLTLHRPEAYVVSHRLAVALFGASLVALIGAQVSSYLRPVSFESRQRVKILVLGMVGALTPQVMLTLGSAVTGGQASENFMGWSGVLFPLALGYAVLREDLLQVDALLRRSLNYALLTLVVAAAYAGGAILLQSVLSPSGGAFRWTAPAIFAAFSVLVLLPLRDRLQSGVDRVFFRSAYDFRRLVETSSARLASATDLGVISREVRRAVQESLQPEWRVFRVRDVEAVEIDCDADLPDAPGVEADVLRRARASGAPTDIDGGGLVVPFCLEGRLVAVLALGRRLSGRLYSGDDRTLLQTLANQGALALENALALVQLRGLNRELEAKVEERTSALRNAQGQLVQQEKMASLGRLVAGVAHEINNPLNFVHGNMHHLQEYADELTRAVADYEAALGRTGEAGRVEAIREKHDLDYLVGDLGAAMEACQEGLDRTLGIVKDLRTFSRLDRGEPSAVDLVDALESTLTLLQGRLDGLQVERDLQPVPSVSCLAGPMNQVFTNLVSNAADAVEPGGRIAVRTRAAGDRVVVEIEDDGCGIAPEQLDRIFEPFFTTKEVGRGTGLGLAISYGVVKRHGGEIVVESQPGRGTCFRVELPVAFQAEPDAGRQ